MSKEMEIELINGHGFQSSSNSSDLGVIIRGKTSYEVCGGFCVMEWLANNRKDISKVFALLEIVLDGEVTFL